MQRRHFIASGLTAAAAVTLPSLVAASTIPTAPVRIVVGFPPGGGTDVMARVMAQKLAIAWGVPVTVENKAGAGGVIAAEYVAKQPANGTVLLMTNISNHAIAPALYPTLGYVVERDFTPLVLVGVTPNLLICNPDQPARTVKDLVALCRAKPGTVTFGSSGAGASQHMAIELFKLRAKVDALHVPYRGSGPMLTDLIGGQINYSFETMTSATPHVASGKLVALAQTRLQRSPAHPNVPTVDELGYPGFDASTWYGLVGPAQMPSDMVQRMNEDFNRVLAMPDVAAKLASYGAEDGGGTAAKFTAFIATEKDKWAQVVKEARVTV